TATFSGGGKGTTVYLVNLTANGLVYWGVTVKATVQKTQYTAPGSEGSCPAGSPSKVLSTSDVTLPGLAGYLNTSMGIVGAHVNASATGANRILVSWNNSMPAQSWLNITPPSLTNYYNPAYVDPETFVETNLSSGTYSFSGTSLSQPGGIPPNSKPNVSENIGPPTSTAEKGTWTEGVCGFVPGLLQLSNVALTNITITNASLSWQTNFRSNGTVSLYTFGDNTTTTTSWVTSETGGGSTWTTKFELHGLREFTSYSFRILVNMTYCGITYNALSASTSFQTPDDFYVWAYDEPYDSITQEGGGTQIAWVLPQFFVKATTFSDGTIVYYPTGNNSATAIVPLLQVSPLWPSGLSDSVSFVANLSLPLPNTNYTIAVLLNYTYVGTNQSVNATSFAYTFTHLKDTSGDGLTDSEKIYGWSVTTQTTTGSWNPAHDVTADPTLWATNGLTNDFVEKEFGLDPGTVDSAGSHVLDTWNLTFDLGRSNQNPLPPAGADLHYWYANSSLHPFSSCQYPGQPGTPSCSSFIQGANLTNLTQAGDSSPWSSEVLWDRSQLSVFYNLTGVKAASWLRAEFGSYGSLRTLTIWGKLSWGANPLATSTPQDGLADGQRINPLYDEDLQMDFLNYGVDVCGNIPSMAGAALQLHVTGAVGGYAGNNYTAPINLSACPGGNGGTSYELTLPVDNTVEAETVEVTFIANISTNASPAPQLLPVNACNWRYNLTVAMLNATPETNGRGGGAVIVYGNPSGSCGAPAHGVRTHVSFGVSEVPAGLKVPTYLWIPNDNSTLSSLPWGLKRYTGEQSFDLVTITDTDGGSHVRSDLIPTPWGGPGYYVSATTGMIQFLVPRGQFLNSTFGESILLNSTLPNAKVPGNGPLLASNQSGAIANNSNPATLADLSCYWQNRAVWNQPWLCSGGETGTPSNHTATLTVVDASSCGGSNCGGVPFNPSLETTAYAGPALQFVASFNLSSTLGSTSGELDAIVAALVDNSSGGLNGTFVNITTEIPTLALSSALVTSMANAVLPSGGNYGVPVSHAVAPPKPSGNPFVAFLVNSASGILYDIQTGNWLGVIWDVITAPLAFQVFLAVEMAKVYLAVANRTASALAGVGAALKAELASFLDWIITQAKATLATGTSPVTSVTSAYSLDVNSSISVAGSTIGPSGNISQGGAQSMWAAQSGTLFQDSVTLSYIVAVVFGIVVALTAALASMLVSALLGLLLAFAVSAVIQLTAQSIAIPLIYGVEDWANGTCGSQAPNQVTWRTLADSIGWYDAGMTSSLAGRQLWIASHSSGGASLKSVALFVFSLIAAVVGFYSYFNHSNQLAVWSLGMGAIGLFFDLIAGGVATSPVDKQIVDASFALDIAAFGISALELHN
ncbi:MAG TPA: hypothetical protein VMH38_07975, partial [Thermoplasmata archaeon]|nr:hypothetical protein [Thermoplasmata archaeon]